MAFPSESVVLDLHAVLPVSLTPDRTALAIGAVLNFLLLLNQIREDHRPPASWAPPAVYDLAESSSTPRDSRF